LKYVGFWEYEPENAYKMFDLDKKMGEEYRRDTAKWQEKYGKFLGAYFLGMEPRGMSLFEFDKPEQMVNMERAYWPYKKWRFTTLIETGKVQEIYWKKQTEEG
jgi:hypothetical protein